MAAFNLACAKERIHDWVIETLHGRKAATGIDRNAWLGPVWLSFAPVGNRFARPMTVTHLKADHPYQRDESIPQWHGWHAARRGLGSNLYRLGVPDKVIQRILRHAHVSTTLSYYVKSKPQDALDAMTKLEKAIPENSVFGHPADTYRKFS